MAKYIFFSVNDPECVVEDDLLLPIITSTEDVQSLEHGISQHWKCSFPHK